MSTRPPASRENAHLVRQARDVLDEIDTLHACLSALGDLITPEEDLHVVNRDNLAILVGYLNDRLFDAASELRRSILSLYFNVGEPA